MNKQARLILAIVLAALAAIGIQLVPVQVATSPSVLASVGKHSAGSFVVTSTADSGPGTLRQALRDAQPGDTITFDASIFPPAAPVTITLTTSLPTLIRGNLTLNASNAGVVLDGSQLSGGDTHGLDISSDGNVVRGLEILNFSGAAVGLREGASGNIVEDNLLSGDGSFGVGIWGTETTGNTIRNNLIGTDRSGQAAGGLTRDAIHIYQAGQNTITGNRIAGAGQSGVYICCGGAGNTVSNNTIGLAIDDSTPLPNGQAGVTIDQGAHDTVIGPENVIAHNPIGVAVTGADSVGNAITQNRIYSNTEGISLAEGGNGEPTPPTIIGFNLSAGTVEGVTCAHCTVEIFSTPGDQGNVCEGQTTSDGVGYFTLDAGSAFDGPHLTATATNAAGNTSGFSQPTSGEQQGVDLQTGNTHPKTLIPTRSGSDLAENYIGDQIGGLRTLISTEGDAEHFLDYYQRTGYKWTRLSLDPLDWSDVAEDPSLYSQWEVDPLHDAFITKLAERGTTIIYCLVFWDEEIEPVSEPGYSRFESPDEITRYLNYADFIVTHFSGQIAYYEVFNESFYEPSTDFHQQSITLDAYENIVDLVVPVIRTADPNAKVIAGPAPAVYGQDCYDYELGILSSDLTMPVVDGVSWHPGPYPLELGGAVDHLYRVPETIQEMQNTAESHGFTGDYIPEEIQWPTPYNPSPSEPWNVYSETVSAKYFGRGILDHRGLGMPALLAGTASEGNLPKMDVIRNLANLLAGAEPARLSLQVQSALTEVISYTFAYTGGDGYLMALWQDSFASNEIEPGTPLTLTVSGFATTLQLLADSNLSVTGYDVLHNFRQPLDAYVDGDSLVIPNLRVRDYPLVLRLAQIKRVFLPIVLRNQH